MMIAYQDWTAEQVRDWLVEAAATADKLPGGYGPRREPGNGMPEVVREKWKDAAPNATVSRPHASSFAIARMEAVWTWVNGLSREDDRRLLYDWSEAKALGRGYLHRIMERNPLTERTLSNSVLALCQGVAKSLNRKQEVRLSGPIDEAIEISDPVRDYSVASKNCATPPKTPRHTGPSEKSRHDSSEATILSIEKHMAAVRRRRQNEAKRRERRQRDKRKRAA